MVHFKLYFEGKQCVPCFSISGRGHIGLEQEEKPIFFVKHIAKYFADEFNILQGKIIGGKSRIIKNKLEYYALP